MDGRARKHCSSFLFLSHSPVIQPASQTKISTRVVVVIAMKEACRINYIKRLQSFEFVPTIVASPPYNRHAGNQTQDYLSVLARLSCAQVYVDSYVRLCGGDLKLLANQKNHHLSISREKETGLLRVTAWLALDYCWLDKIGSF